MHILKKGTVCHIISLYIHANKLAGYGHVLTVWIKCLQSEKHRLSVAIRFYIYVVKIDK